MKAIICVDDDGGMLFNYRRQSRDIEIIRDIDNNLLMSNPGIKLWMNEYSFEMFKNQCENQDQIVVDEEYLDKVNEDDYCFIESHVDIEALKEAKEIMIYKWNRKYPSDYKLDIAVKDSHTKSEMAEFVGNSHEKITKELYIRNI